MRFEPPAAECTIYTFKDGLLSAIAHDLQIRVTRFHVDVERGQGARTPITAHFDARSLRVMTAMSHGRPHGALTEADKRTIERNIVEDVLDARRFPDIRFEARAVDGSGEVRSLGGTLFLHGREKAIAFEARLRGASWRAEIPIHQPDFGIKPFSAMLGTLKIRPDLVVRVSLPVSASDTERETLDSGGPGGPGDRAGKPTAA